MTIYDVDATELVEGVAEELKKIEDIRPPVWASFVKTGAHKERPPVREDWWYVRAASVLRNVRLKGPIGVSKLRTLYGGKQNRGYKPEIFKKGSGNIVRKILQQLQKAELIKKGDKGVHKGRIAAPKGIKLMDDVANNISGKKPVEKKEGPKTTEQKTKNLVKKTKEFAEGKIPTADKLVEEVKKAQTKPKEVQAQTKDAKTQEKGKVPTAEELAKKKEEKK